jgi:uncharacterized protein YjbI with pentapeptide repeats
MQNENQIYPILELPHDVLKVIFIQVGRTFTFAKLLQLKELSPFFNSYLTENILKILESDLYPNIFHFLSLNRDYYKSFAIQKIITSHITQPLKNNDEIEKIFPDLVAHGMLYAPHFRICSAIIQRNLTPKTYFFDTEKTALKIYCNKNVEKITGKELAVTLYAFLTIKQFTQFTLNQFKNFFQNVQAKLATDKFSNKTNSSPVFSDFMNYYNLIKKLKYSKKLYIKLVSQACNNQYFKNLPELHLSKDATNVNFDFAHLDGLVILGGTYQRRWHINFNCASVKNAYFGTKKQKNAPRRAKLLNSQFCYADISGSTFEEMLIENVNFTKANSENVSFTDCNLINVKHDLSDLKNPPWNILFSEQNETQNDDLKEMTKFQQLYKDQLNTTKLLFPWLNPTEPAIKPNNNQEDEDSTETKLLILAGATPQILTRDKLDEKTQVRSTNSNSPQNKYLSKYSAPQIPQEVYTLLEFPETPSNIEMSKLKNAFVFDTPEQEDSFFNENAEHSERIAHNLGRFGLYSDLNRPPSSHSMNGNESYEDFSPPLKKRRLNEDLETKNSTVKQPDQFQDKPTDKLPDLKHSTMISIPTPSIATMKYYSENAIIDSYLDESKNDNNVYQVKF